MRFLCIAFFLTSWIVCPYALSQPSFEIPSTVCSGQPVTITNTTPAATTYWWNFCAADPNVQPTAVNLGNPGGRLSTPVFSDIVRDNGNYYVFVTNHIPSGLIRLDFGADLLSTPTAVTIGNPGGVIPTFAEGLQVVSNNGRWYAIIVGGRQAIGAGSGIARIDFGPDITNTAPVGTNWGNIGNLAFPVDLHMFQENGAWYGLTINSESNTITRFSFTSDLANMPTAVNLGNLGNLALPTGIYTIKVNNNWHVFIPNDLSSSLTRLDFGTSLLNTPTAVNLGNLGVLSNPRDIYIFQECGQINGFVVNANGLEQLIKLNFNNNITSVPTGINLGNIGGFSFPHSISELFRVQGDLYTFVTNAGNNTISRVRFPGCNNSGVIGTTAVNPNPVFYNASGTYNINLTIDDGLPTMATMCKQVRVMSCDSVIVNDYTPVLSLDVCKNIINVEDATEFNPGDTVLLMQMQGATVNLVNGNTFGDITNYNNAGNYEYNYVKSKTGNQVELLNVLTRQYDVPAGKVQLVRVPYYQDFKNDKIVTCLPWDGSKGGVLAFNVANSLQLDRNIDVSGKGFRGGNGRNTQRLVQDCNLTNYVLNGNNVNTAFKGESIAALAIENSGGRGASASGGGAGLDHNSGGGGGGNGGTGGFGGYQLDACTNGSFDNRGIPGRTLTYSTAINKVFMGGAGGAGHANNPANSDYPSNGANGGGIVIISAQTMQSNSFKIVSNGGDAPGCPFNTTNDCHDAMGGGGAGGTVLLNIPSYIDPATIEIKGGKGADVSGPVRTVGNIGPGGGGGGGVFWSSQATFPANVTVDAAGGQRGICLQDNDPWGTTDGAGGVSVFDLQLPIATVPFKINIDSVRFDTNKVNCSRFDFEGLAYINGTPITTWQWFFGDGGTAGTQNASHEYLLEDDYQVKLIATDVNGCKDSMMLDLSIAPVSIDFNYSQQICDPLYVEFTAVGTPMTNVYWNLGDGSPAVTGVTTIGHTYDANGDYEVVFASSSSSCTDTVRKTIAIEVLRDNIILTPDTTICYGVPKLLRSVPSLNYCWTPVTYLDNPDLQNPTTSTPGKITYFLNAEVTGDNLIVNGDFAQGNTGFISDYNFKPPPNDDEGQYFIGTNPTAWNGGMSNCSDHSPGDNNMMMVNGAPGVDEVVWGQTIAVTPNRNYAFSTWIQSVSGVNPAELQFSINSKNVGTVITASLPTCNWTQFYTTWNSGNSTSAVISIVNRNTIRAGNDFALDDISFAPVFIKRDSVIISIDTPFVQTIPDPFICITDSVELTSTGNVVTWEWTPATDLSQSNIANPKASPGVSTQYTVTGATAHGCETQAIVNVNVHPVAVITKAPDIEICKNTSTEIWATGGGTYDWSPGGSLNSTTLPNPTATPTASTMYYVTITDVNDCNYYDSVKVDIRPDPVFTVTAPHEICATDSVQLRSSGGDIYVWQPATDVTDPSISNPRTAPGTTTDYFVTITETTCNESATLSTRITVNPLPDVQATSQRNLDCAFDRSQLNVTGANRYIWRNDPSLSNPNIPNPIASPKMPTSYVVRGYDLKGCSNTDTILVDITQDNKGNYVIPNAFTPNGDGLNECFGIKFWGVVYEMKLDIYNRWGQLMFTTTDPNACWDGTFKGQMQTPDVFVYMVTAKTNCEPHVFRKGTFTLIR